MSLCLPPNVKYTSFSSSFLLSSTFSWSAVLSLSCCTFSFLSCAPGRSAAGLAPAVAVSSETPAPSTEQHLSLPASQTQEKGGMALYTAGLLKLSTTSFPQPSTVLYTLPSPLVHFNFLGPHIDELPSIPFLKRDSEQTLTHCLFLGHVSNGSLVL